MRQMLKLIASDIDGTLIPYGGTGISRELFALIPRLKEKGVLFCAASGRQLHSLRKLFAPVAEELIFLCENGAAVYGAGPEGQCPLLCKTPMPRTEAEALSRDIMALEDCEVMISGANTSYLAPRHTWFPHLLEERTGNRIALVRDPSQVPEDILKVSVYCPQGPKAAKTALEGQWSRQFRMAVAGPDWLDFTLADKGRGLSELCGTLQIRPEEVAAFGDNYNDVPMLEWAGTGYLMDTAAAELKARFPLQCRSVEAVLERLLAE